MRIRFAVLSSGFVGESAGVLLEHVAAGNAAAQTWPPFVLVTGLLMIGVVANGDGVFARAAGLLGTVPGGGVSLNVAAMLLVAIVTVLLNLDTAVTFPDPGVGTRGETPWSRRAALPVRFWFHGKTRRRCFCQGVT